MAASQQPIPGRPTPSQGGAPHAPPQANMVLQHPQPQLVPVGATTAHFPQTASFPHQIPLQHQQRGPVMNGISANHPNFAALQNSQAAMAVAAQQQRQAAQMRMHQGGAGMAPAGAAAQLAGVGPYPQHMLGPGGLHPQHLHQFQQQNPGIRIPPHQILPGQHMIQPQAMPGPGIQHVPLQQGAQATNIRYWLLFDRD